MASLLCSSSFLLVGLAALALLAEPSLSTSRRALTQPKPLPAGFRVGIWHVDSGRANLTKFERLQRGINRGRNRLHRLISGASLSAAASSSDVEAPVDVGSGEFLMKVGIGTPPETFPAIMDTGSDLIWTQCRPCDDCFNQSTPIFDPKHSSSFSKLSCTDTLCDALPASTCNGGGCEYLYTYGDYSSTQGTMAAETFTFGDGASVPRVAFGCGTDNQGDGFSQGAGLVGLGRGPLSLVSQLDEPKFAYCLTAIDDTKPSSLVMGSAAGMVQQGSSTKPVTTRLIKNQAQPSFYYLPLEGITVGDTRLSVPKSTFEIQDDGSGGVIIDSGTTITYLEQSAFDEVKKEFVAQTKLDVDTSSNTGLDLCFKSGSDGSEAPKLVLHFDGADLELPRENYLIGDHELGVTCLAMGGASGMSILGNVQQQDMLVFHDLAKETLSFAPTKCSHF